MSIGDGGTAEGAERGATALEASTGAQLRKIRLDRGLSLTAVAHRAEVTKGFLSQLERGLTSVSVPTLLRVCEVLRIGVGELFAYPDEHVMDGGSRIDMGGEGVTEYLLTPADSTAFQVFRSVIEPGGGTGGPYRLDTTTIFAMGLSGSTRLIVGGETRTLSAGASTSFSGQTLHQFDNPGTTVSEVLWVLSPPLLRAARGPAQITASNAGPYQE
ncbi:XRE family transcriptional regulator [Streptomyces sp. WAC 04229]|uniref:helix-turn-helix domain-containing protein n=1 Tax=Streptomyces sp. WAC 04229 TaxID=2203206 RepID=UPI000F73EE55|nr:XRE family transcriptional regulator [Streptomyces sp. WAC 04229]RSN64708.1 XRE family transcriptional regulator [Streptomyces sp. WAC 04229]